MIKEAGFGSSSYVLQAVSEDNDIAIKVIRKESLHIDEHKNGGISREIKALQLLHHPNIVALKEVINDKNSPELLLVMQFLSGKAFDDLENIPSSD